MSATIIRKRATFCCIFLLFCGLFSVSYSFGITNNVDVSRRICALTQKQQKQHASRFRQVSLHTKIGYPLSSPSYHDPRRFWTSLQQSSSDVTTNASPTDDDNKNNNYPKDKLAGILVLLTVPLSWGTYGPVVRYLYAIQPPVPGFVFSACYYLLAAITTVTIATLMRIQNTTTVTTTISSGEEDGDNDNFSSSSMFSSFPIAGGIELGSYLFIANCLQVIGLRSVESDRAGFLVQLTTVFVPFVEALFARNLSAVPTKTWFACILAFSGLIIMGIDGKESSSMILDDPFTSVMTAFSSFTGGDFLIISAAILYTLHVVRLGTYAKETSPIELAASKATVETIFSVLLVFGLMMLAPLAGTVGGQGTETVGLIGFAAESGREISSFFSSFSEGLASGSISETALVSATGAILWTGWVTCAYTIFAQSFGQSRVSPTNANLIYTFQPIFTAMFAYFLLGETMGPAGFAGGAIIALAVYFVASTTFVENDDDNPTASVRTTNDFENEKLLEASDSSMSEQLISEENNDEINSKEESSKNEVMMIR